jgi:predicted nucleotidyltransferase
MTVLHFWYPLRPEGLSIRVDLLAGGTGHAREAVARAVVRKIDGSAVKVASCEDLILLKLAAGRPIDVADARELLAINRGSLDRAALEARAASLGLADALRAIAAGEERS